jgi:hypothetical protein
MSWDYSRETTFSAQVGVDGNRPEPSDGRQSRGKIPHVLQQEGKELPVSAFSTADKNQKWAGGRFQSQRLAMLEATLQSGLAMRSCNQRFPAAIVAGRGSHGYGEALVRKEGECPQKCDNGYTRLKS